MQHLISQRGAGLADTFFYLSVVCAIVAFTAPKFLKLGPDSVTSNEREIVKIDLDIIQKAMTQLEKDTGMLTGYPGPNPCVNSSEHLIDRNCRLGLLCTNGKHKGWAGPYLPDEMRDPWGNPYYLDNDFYRGEQKSRVLGSMGPNGVQDYTEAGDDIILVLCTQGVW